MINSLSNSKCGIIKQDKANPLQKGTVKTASSAMTDGFVQQIETLAKRDAQKGIYMDKGYLQLQRSQMKQYVSPDRSGPMNQVTQVMQEVAKEDDPLLELLTSLLRRLSGKVQHMNGQTFVSLNRMSGNCSANIHSNSCGQTAEVCSPNGEVIASYNSNGGGWTVVQTKEELDFQSQADSVYAQAFRAARAEIKAQSLNPQIVSASIDIQA